MRQTLASDERYSRLTLRPLESLVFISPLLLLFHIGSLTYGTGLLALRDLDRLLGFFGATAPYLPALLVVVVLLAQHQAHRYRWRIHGKVLLGMLAESVAWMVPLVAMSLLVGRGSLAAGGNEEGILRYLLIAAGAGIYEEFLFRLMMISLVMMIFVDVFELNRDVVAVAAVLLASVVFSAYHLTGESFESFPWGLFAFRAVAGVYLSGLYVFRGFGIAVGAHVIYNLYVFL
ncbi:MAG: type II CAAX prenyl endopeptidase Rce1 family protein [Phycisphaerae bacterium]